MAQRSVPFLDPGFLSPSLFSSLLTTTLNFTYQFHLLPSALDSVPLSKFTAEAVEFVFKGFSAQKYSG